MDYWAGELGNNYINGIKHSNVMDSVFNYLQVENPVIKYPYDNLFLDNGAFSIFKNNFNNKKQKIKIDLNNIIDIQEIFNPKFTVPFDYPFQPDMTIKEMEDNWEESKKNIVYWRECTNLNLVPALHGWNKKSLDKNINFLQKKDFDYVALGSTFILKDNFKGFFGDRQPNKNVYEAFLFLSSLAKKIDMDLHVFGLGSSPLSYHIAAFCEIKSSDSSGYRRKAAYGKIILPQTGERYAGNGSANFGVNRNKGLNFDNIFTEDEKDKLANCNCPECRKISKHSFRRWKHLCSDWKYRAIHNKWVMEQEEKISQELIKKGWDIYEKFIDNMMEKSGLRWLWEFVKKVKPEYF
jgi:queuine/archaeosine tRNA-ribosyltransferase